MKKLLVAALTIASTSAFASNEMYALGGIGLDNSDIGAQFTLGSQIAQSNWYVESTLLAISMDDKYSYQDPNSNVKTVEEDFDSLMISLAPMYKYSLNNSFAIYGKLGAFYSHSDTKLKFSTNNSTEVHKGSHNDIGLTYGIGVEYKSPTPMFGRSKLLARAGFDWYEFGGSSGWYTADSALGMQVGFTF